MVAVLGQQLAFIASLDATAIREACPESLEDDQDAFLSVLCDRSPLQRAALSDQWEADIGCTLAVQVRFQVAFLPPLPLPRALAS